MCQSSTKSSSVLYLSVSLCSPSPLLSSLSLTNTHSVCEQRSRRRQGIPLRNGGGRRHECGRMSLGCLAARRKLRILSAEAQPGTHTDPAISSYRAAAPGVRVGIYRLVQSDCWSQLFHKRGEGSETVRENKRTEGTWGRQSQAGALQNTKKCKDNWSGGQ